MAKPKENLKEPLIFSLNTESVNILKSSVKRKLNKDHSDKLLARFKAEELIDFADMTDKPEDLIRYAEEAVKADEDCIDAYILLGLHKAKNLREEKKYFLQAVRAGKRSLKGKYKDVDYDYQVNRDFYAMTFAMGHLSRIYWLTGKLFESIELDYKILSLDREDYYQDRYKLTYKLQFGTMEESIHELMNDFKEENSLHWDYSKAFLNIMENKSEKETIKLLEKAMLANPFIPLAQLDYFDCFATMPAYENHPDFHKYMELMNFYWLMKDVWINNKKMYIRFIKAFANIYVELIQEVMKSNYKNILSPIKEYI